MLLSASTGELGKVMKRLNEAVSERDSIDEQISNVESEIEKAEQEKEDFDKKLKKYRDIRELVEKRETLDEQIRQLELEMQGLRAELRDRVGRSAMLLCSPEIHAAFKHIDTITPEEWVPTPR